jgi:hypothetical protein
MSGWLRAMLASALWLCAARVRADASSSLDAQLEVQPDASGCIAQRSLSARVAHWLKRPPQAGVAVVVHAASQPVSFSVEREGRVVAERSFEHLPASCADRLDALALAVALAIERAAESTIGDQSIADAAVASTAASAGVQADTSTGEAKPQASKPEAPAQASSEPSAKGEAAPAPPQAAKPAPTQVASAATPAAKQDSARDDRTQASSNPRLRAGALRLEAGASYLWGVLPSPTGLISAGLEWIVAPRLELRFAGVLVPASETALTGGSAHSQVYGARVLACGLVRAGVFGIEACAGGVGGVVRATGKDFESNPSATMAWFAAAARLGLRFPADSAISLRIAADGLANIERPELRVVSVERGGQLQTASGHKLGAAGSIELLFALP